MIRTTVIHCAACGMKRDSANGWFLIIPMALDGIAGQLVLPYSGEALESTNTIPLCGAACLTKELFTRLGTAEPDAYRAQTA